MDFTSIIHATIGTLCAARPAEDDTSFLQSAIETFETFARDRAVPASPMLALRIADVVSAWLLVRTLETQVRQALDPQAPPPDTSGEPPVPRLNLNTLLTAAARAWDRLRKALKHFESTLPTPDSHAEDAPGSDLLSILMGSQTGGRTSPAAGASSPVPATSSTPPESAPAHASPHSAHDSHRARGCFPLTTGRSPAGPQTAHTAPGPHPAPPTSKTAGNPLPPLSRTA